MIPDTLKRSMKKLSDYNFCDSWVFREVDLESYAEYVVLADLCDLKKGERVKFIGFDDVDNHYGIFVFVDADGAVREVYGDFAGRTHPRLLELKAAIARAQAGAT